MKLEFKSFKENNFDEVAELVRLRFSDHSVAQLKRCLRSPARCGDESVGDVAYRDGKVVCFQAAVPRQLFWRQKGLRGIVGGMLCKTRKGCPLSALIEIMERTKLPRGESVMTFGNTSNSSATDLSVGTEISGWGPPTCARVRFTVIHLGNMLQFCLHGRCPGFLVSLFNVIGNIRFCFLRSPSTVGLQIRKLNKIDSAALDGFWRKYLEGNVGLVCSRTAAELSWLFADRLEDGTCAMFAGYDGDEVVGYVVIKANAERTRWMIVDWIALENDALILKALLRCVVSWLRSVPEAAMLESVGFTENADGILRRVLRFARKLKNNTFNYSVHGELPPEMVEAMRSGTIPGWFFGPYDGDRCM